MRRISALFIRSLTLGLTAYALVYTREVPTAYAQTVVDTDCSTDLDQPDTTYRLTADVPGDCIIAANNIILDGQSLYTISGDVTATTTATVDFTVQNVTVVGDVYAYGLTVDVGNIIIERAQVDGSVLLCSQNYNVGSISVLDANVGDIIAVSNGHSIGSVTIENVPTINSVFVYGFDAIGAITVSDSIITDTLIGYSYSGNGTVTIQNSDIAHLRGNSIATITNSIIGTGPGQKSVVSAYEITLVGSGIYGATDVAILTATNSMIDSVNGPYANTCTLIDSTIANSLNSDPVVVTCGSLNLTDTPPTLTVTPLSLELDMGEVFNPFSGVSADDVKDGDISDDVMVVGTVGEEPGTYELIYSITDSGTALFNTNGNATTTSGPSTASTTRTVTRRAAETGGSESTRVGERSSTHTNMTTPTTPISTAASASLDETLTTLRTVLSQPITTTDPEQLKKILDILLQIAAALAQVLALQGKE